MYNLSQKEFEIVKLTAEGLTNKEIAEKMDLSEVAIKKHLARIYDKLGVEGKKELLIFSLKNKL